MMDWDLISTAEAEAFRDHIAGRERARLIDLAHLMRDTGGPLELLDGSRDSIVPLWVWFAEQTRAGFPGVPERRSALEVFWHLDLDPVDSRSRYAVEPIAHYLALVCRGYFENFEWALWPSGPKRNYRIRQDQSTILQAGEHIVDPIDLTWSLANIHFRSDNERLSPTRLLFVFDNWFENGSVSRFPPHPLAPYSDMDAVPLDDPIRVPPRLGILPSPDGEGPASDVTGLALTLARGELSDLEALDRIPPLDEAAVADYLQQAEFKNPDGSSTDLSELGVHSIQLIQRDGHAILETLVAAGRLRGISLEPLNASSEQWDRIEEPFLKLATSLNARVNYET